MVYGYRRPPYGVRGCVCDDGITWDVANEFTIREGGVPAAHYDNPGIFQHIGYPARGAPVRRLGPRDVPRAHRQRRASDPVHREHPLPPRRLTRLCDSSRRALTVPTLANAVELFGDRAAQHRVQPRAADVSLPVVRHVRRATPSRVQARTDRPADARRTTPEYWRWLEARPGPKIVVVEDLDETPGGAMWGEWNANVHRALGCVGTDHAGRGARPRRARAPRASTRSPRRCRSRTATACSSGTTRPSRSRACASKPATCSWRISTVSCASRPRSRSPDLAAVAREIDRLEAEIFAFCQSPEFTVDGLARLQESVLDRWPRPR